MCCAGAIARSLPFRWGSVALEDPSCFSKSVCRLFVSSGFVDLPGRWAFDGEITQAWTMREGKLVAAYSLCSGLCSIDWEILHLWCRHILITPGFSFLRQRGVDPLGKVLDFSVDILWLSGRRIVTLWYVALSSSSLLRAGRLAGFLRFGQASKGAADRELK
ncbi:hypothetical protein BKA80DRAFT_33269 [Phyllosticta citrichinensis]